MLFPAANGGAARVWAAGKWREVTTLAPEGIVRDAVQTTPGRWLLLCQVSQEEAVLYEYAEAKLRLVGRLAGSFDKPTLHPARDGSAWVTSSEGSAYCLKDGKTAAHAFGPKVNKNQGCYTYYPPTVSLELPNHGLWFWSHVQHEALNFGGGPKLAIEGFQVYQNGEWRVVSHDGGKLGGAVLENSDTLIAGSRYKGMFSVSLKDGEIREMDYQLPPNEHCLFLHRAPAGHLLLVAARPSMFTRLAPEHDGWSGQLLAVTEGQARTLLSGVDFKQISNDKGRPVVDVNEGTFLAEAQSGLIFVSSDLNTVKRLDWQYGVQLPNIDRMRSHGQQLFVLDRERGFAVFDYPMLLQMREIPTSRNWAVFASASPPALSLDSSLWYMTASEPAELRHWVGTNELSVSMDGSEFPAKSLWYLTTDTKDRPWLISNFETHRTAFLDAGKWRTFDLRETAYSTVAKEEAGNPEYGIGKPSDHCYPAFSGDGRVAYQNEWSRICFFDGEKWNAGYGEGKIDGRSPEGPPFYIKGVLTARAGDSYYQYVNGKWQQTFVDVKSPYGGNPRRNDVRDIPESFPDDPSKCAIRLRDNLGNLWLGNPDALWRSLGDIWLPFAAQGSPLCLASGVTHIQTDGSGAIWFALGGGQYTRLARYQPGGSPPRVDWAEAPGSEIDTGFFECVLRIIGSSTNFIVRRQMDEDAWKQASVAGPRHVVRFDGLRNGRHTMRVQAFDELFRASGMLEHRITVNRDYSKEIRLWTPLLLSPGFSDRERAAKALVDIGRPALPALRALESDADVNMQWWIRAVKAEIERQRQ